MLDILSEYYNSNNTLVSFVSSMVYLYLLPSIAIYKLIATAIDKLSSSFTKHKLQYDSSGTKAIRIKELNRVSDENIIFKIEFYYIDKNNKAKLHKTIITSDPINKLTSDEIIEIWWT